MTEYSRKFVSETLLLRPVDASVDGELALRADSLHEIRVSSRKTMGCGLIGWYGRILYGRSFAPLTDLMADAKARCSFEIETDRGARLAEATHQARASLRHAALARASLITVIGFCLFVATVVLAHETRNTQSVYQDYLANPTVARAPEQSWGYTPLLYDLPEGLKSNLIAFDRTIESAFVAFGMGQSKSGSSSVQSRKLSAAIMSLFGLIPLVQFGLGQSGKARTFREKAFEAIAGSSNR